MSGLMLYAPEKSTGLALCRLMKRRSLEPEYYDNAEDILEKIRFGAAGTIILDCSSFPSMNAITKEIEEILSSAEGIPLIIITPYSEKEMENFRKRGYYIVEKPICLDHLVTLIKQINK